MNDSSINDVVFNFQIVTTNNFVPQDENILTSGNKSLTSRDQSTTFSAVFCLQTVVSCSVGLFQVCRLFLFQMASPHPQDLPASSSNGNVDKVKEPEKETEPKGEDANKTNEEKAVTEDPYEVLEEAYGMKSYTVQKDIELSRQKVEEGRRKKERKMVDYDPYVLAPIVNQDGDMQPIPFLAGRLPPGSLPQPEPPRKKPRKPLTPGPVP